MRAYEVASLKLLPYQEQCARVRTLLAVTLCARYNTENTWLTTRLPPFSCAISTRFKFCIPTVTVFFVLSMVALIQLSHITRFRFVNEQPNFHILIHVQSLSTPHSGFSTLLYPCLLSLGLKKRFDPSVLTFRTAISYIGNIYIYIHRLKVMILWRTSGTPRCFLILYKSLTHSYISQLEPSSQTC